ncbi:DUF6361 family protein [Rhizobium ruizarguesonis]|uniref:DUF6361 family protein n=1 Tax=Rhizobium ruizarguesonis TaxID=2081791 RepID=UPI0010368948|nr:DUF6361 family protein [Rhizobium ruizarguesonis]NEI81393.1 hypothetical protein [Rhizobium ruizarguesonis]NEK06919.1 hypothetical protein [Rhizobium ruizarguesonis]TBD39632.1 hypothetical protein ELH18_20145 [Rhizobium ruizarguesonis]
MSAFGWVSFGKAEADAVQVLIGALSDTEARDELGLGAIRDGFSDLLFPGTSTVQTRLRYFLFLPQVFRELDLRQKDRRAALRAGEAALIERLKALPDADTTNLIGAEVGAKLKRMPSEVYWGGLGAWGLRRDALNHSGIGEVLERMAAGEDCWAEDIPKISRDDEGGFTLTAEEANWLKERCVVIRGRKTLLGYLMSQCDDMGDIDSLQEVGGLDLPPDLHRQLAHALAFSSTMYGAGILYNLMLAEHFEHETYDHYASALEDWRRAQTSQLAKSGKDLIAPLIGEGVALGFRPNDRLDRTLNFVDQWLAVMHDPSGKPARTLIENRELQIKGRSRARLFYVPQDYRWSGNSGAAQMNFRWGRVQQYLQDLATAV